MEEHTIIVAITVTAADRELAQEALTSWMPTPREGYTLLSERGRAVLESWWIAEDDATDGNDCDSAIFVPRGAQDTMRDVIRGYFDHHEQEWQEDGYPFADTDVSGAWFPGDYRNAVESGACRHCGRHIVRTEADGWVDPQATGDDHIWRETCDAHDTFTAEHEPEEN